MAKKPPASQRRRIQNRKATFEYQILQTVEAGIALMGSEVKSLRAGKASIEEAFARIIDGEVYLFGCNIEPYVNATVIRHEPTRTRKLLLHRREIKKLHSKVTLAGHTLIPLSIFFNDKGLAKLELALARGKTYSDKREDIKKREHGRDIERAMRRR